MNKELKNNLTLLIVLIISAILLISLDAKIVVDNQSFDSIFFIIACLIVMMTVYVLLKVIVQKHPSFLEKGIWENPLNTLFIGTLVLFIFVLVILSVSNNLQPGPIMNKIMTLVVAYPISFVLILMVDAFYRRIFNVARERRLFISSISIVLVLATMILFSLLSTS